MLEYWETARAEGGRWKAEGGRLKAEGGRRKPEEPQPLKKAASHGLVRLWRKS